jgi:branched-chain amino acid transport system permease protein
MVVLGVATPFLPIIAKIHLINFLLFVGFAYSINFITGLTGYVSFGHAVFMGIGAYALGAGIDRLGVPPLVGVVLGAAFGASFAAGIGLVTLRFRGVYFAIASLVLFLAAQKIVPEISELGGGGGIFMNLGFQPLAQFYTIWTIVVLEIGFTYWVMHGRLGYGLRAIKSDEDAAKAVGVNAPRLKLILFSASGLFAGAAGAVYAWTLSNVLPDTGFDITFSLRMLAMIIIGGAGTLLGPFLGAIIVYVPYNYFQTVQSLLGLQLAVIGLLVLLIALFLPSGIVGAVRRYVPFLRRYIE